ncbi:DUF4177 domain-containing protein [Gymnodinialimonas sp. 57CJ19]|uniref:DUF4177 domain-containing protein n=1 Tax=Gymnodinialimonas sp. 57CJ19 TaxID=3138498 RepID=UPI0031345730
MKTEYKVVPAPEKARKQRGLKGAALFAHSVEALMNELAAEGWQYLRADTLPHEERSGLTNKTTTYRNLLVFQRVVDGEVTQTPPHETETVAIVDVTGTESDDDFEDEPDDDEVVNLWDAPDEAPAPLVADRKG